jgi:hypothetical protein
LSLIHLKYLIFHYVFSWCQKLKKEISAKFRSAFEAQPTLQEGETLNDRELGERRFVSVFGAFKKLAGDLECSHPKLSKFIDEGVEDVLTYLQLPEAHHRKIYSTSLIERINREIKYPRDDLF